MKLTAPKDKLLAAVTAVSGVVKGRTTLPILSCVLVQADADGLKLTATSLDATTISRAEARVERQGGLCVSAKRFADAVRYSAGDEIAIEADEKNVVTLTSESSVFKVRGMAADEFPITPQIKSDKIFSLFQADLARALKGTTYAQCFHDASRYVLRGVLFDFKDELLNIVALNGQRLSVVTLKLTSPLNGSFIVPMESITEIARLLGDSGEVSITFSDNMAVFNAGNILVTKLIEGTFPNYCQVIPNETKDTVVINREQFIESVRRAKVMTSDKAVSVKLQFGKDLVISGSVSDVGEAIDSMHINYKGRLITIACNPDYLLDFASNVEDLEISLGITNELSPIKCMAKDTVGVIMPMRLN